MTTGACPQALCVGDLSGNGFEQYRCENVVSEPTTEEFLRWKTEQEALGRDVRLHEDLGDEGMLWLSWEQEGWVDVYWDRNGTRVIPGYMEVD